MTLDACRKDFEALIKRRLYFASAARTTEHAAGAAELRELQRKAQAIGSERG